MLCVNSVAGNAQNVEHLVARTATLALEVKEMRVLLGPAESLTSGRARPAT